MPPSEFGVEVKLKHLGSTALQRPVEAALYLLSNADSAVWADSGQVSCGVCVLHCYVTQNALYGGGAEEAITALDQKKTGLRVDIFFLIDWLGFPQPGGSIALGDCESTCLFLLIVFLSWRIPLQCVPCGVFVWVSAADMLRDAASEALGSS